MKKDLQIAHVTDRWTAEAFVRQGHFPVGCNFGKEGSISSNLLGFPSHERGIAVQAYKEGRFNMRSLDPRFVCAGPTTADACFAIAALSGELPFAPGSHQGNERGITALASLVSRVDQDPVGIRLDTEPSGDYLLLWMDLVFQHSDALAFLAGVALWKDFALCQRNKFEHLLDAARMREGARIGDALASYKEVGFERFSQRVNLIVSRVWGFNVWYESADVVVRYEPESGEITIGVRNEEKAKELLGQGGLSMFVQHLPETRWGWRKFKSTVYSTVPDEKVRLRLDQARFIAIRLNLAIEKHTASAS